MNKITKREITYQIKEITGFYNGMKMMHYKGGLYTVLSQGTHSETGEDVVIYQNDADKRIWVRPLVMFYDYVDYKDKTVPRFVKLEIEEDVQLPRHYQ